jgi:hypothetical protein
MDRTMSWRSRRLGLFLILVLLTTGKPAFSLVSAG